MALRKQAKLLNKQQTSAMLNYLAQTRHPMRNKVIFLLSIRAGLRAKEIAELEWRMILDSQRNISPSIALEDRASKGNSGRCIPICRDLAEALGQLAGSAPNKVMTDRVITTERSSKTSSQVIINTFARWFADMGFLGCSSHSGRRTFLTEASRKISLVGGSLRDVQSLAGHASLQTTQRYIEVNAEAKRRVVELLM